MRLRLLGVSLAAGLLLSGPLQADVHPNTERGFAAEKAFQTGDLDHVNLFNGNLVITLPVGGSYPVDAGLSYGLTLVYNAQLWDWEEDCLGSDCYARARPGRRFNAGLGWQVSMGQLFDEFDADSSCGPCYMSPDGAEHAFYNKLHEDDVEDPGDSATQQYTLYTRDGTYPGSFSNLAPSAPWGLGTYTEQSTTEGGVTASTLHCFDTATGFLLRRRILAGASPAPHDVVARYTPDARSNVVKEESFGGDIQKGMGTSSNLCGMALTAAEYSLQHTYENGALKTSQYLNGANGAFAFKAVDRDVDASTGLTKVSRDTAGLATSYEYDLLGRLTWAKPGAGHGAWVQNFYARATSGTALATVTTQSFPNGATTGATTTSRVLFDALGRPWRDEVRMPDGTTPQTETLYNALGWKTSVSERNKLTEQTQFLDYDPFGRPRRIVPSDGAAHEVTLQYAGVRSVSRTVRVATTAANESAAATTEQGERLERFPITRHLATTAHNFHTARFCWQLTPFLFTKRENVDSLRL